MSEGSAQPTFAEEIPPLRLLLVHRGEEVPSARIRMLELAPWLAAEGAHVDLAPYPARAREWRRIFASAAAADVVVLQKKLPSPRDALRWSRLAAPIVFDFDDALPFRARPKRGRARSRTRTRRFRRALRLARAVTAGNDALAALCADAGRPVLVAPSPVPYPVPQRVDRPENPLPRVGWIGGSGNLDALQLVAAPLRGVASRRAFRLAVISDRDVDLRGCDVELVPWSRAGQEVEVARLDVGLMPLADDPWSRGKCGYKLLQYMAAGVPVVASPVGVNTRIVEHGVSGLLADSPDAWEDAIERLLTDRDLADRLGERGRATVEGSFTYPHQARRWMSFLRSVAGSPCS